MFAQRLSGGEAINTKAKHSDMTRETPGNNHIALCLNDFYAYYLLVANIEHPHLVSWFHITISLSIPHSRKAC